MLRMIAIDGDGDVHRCPISKKHKAVKVFQCGLCGQDNIDPSDNACPNCSCRLIAYLKPSWGPPFLLRNDRPA